MKNEPANNNDYALAKKLDTTATYLLHGVCDMLRHLEFLDYDEEYYRIIKDANHAYILLMNELDSIYPRNESLAKLNEDPNTLAAWKHFDTIEGNELAIHEFSKGFKNLLDTQNHSIQVERLAIIAGQEEATLTPKLEKLIEEAEVAGAKAVLYGQKKRPRYISSYKLEYKDDGSIVVNGVLLLKKTQSGSAPRKLMEQALKHPYESFKPELGQLSRNFSSVLNDMGITGIIKKIFFPVANKEEVLFRPIVDRSRAENEQIKLDELDKQLKDLGAATRSPFEYNVSDEPRSKEDEAFFNSEEVQLALKEMREELREDTENDT